MSHFSIFSERKVGYLVRIHAKKYILSHDENIIGITNFLNLFEQKSRRIFPFYLN